MSKDALAECEEKLKRWWIEAEYQRRWSEYWRKRFNIADRRSPPEDLVQPEYVQVRKEYEEGEG